MNDGAARAVQYRISNVQYRMLNVQYRVGGPIDVRCWLDILFDIESGLPVQFNVQCSILNIGGGVCVVAIEVSFLNDSKNR